MLDFMFPFLVLVVLTVAIWRLWFVFNGWIQSRLDKVLSLIRKE